MESAARATYVARSRTPGVDTTQTCPPARCSRFRSSEEHLLPSPAQKALTSVDERVENATGRSINELWGEEEAVDAATARVIAAHRELTAATRIVEFNRTLLHRLTSGEATVDDLLLKRIDRAFDQLEQAVERRDLLTADLLHVLQPVEEAARARHTGPTAARLSDVSPPQRR